MKMFRIHEGKTLYRVKVADALCDGCKFMEGADECQDPFQFSELKRDGLLCSGYVENTSGVVTSIDYIWVEGEEGQRRQALGRLLE